MIVVDADELLQTEHGISSFNASGAKPLPSNSTPSKMLVVENVWLVNSGLSGRHKMVAGPP